MKRWKKKPYFENWYFREQAADYTCAFTVEIDYDEEGRMTGNLDIELPDIKRRFIYAHPVNMNMKGSIFLVLDKNVFTEACVHLDIDEPGLSIKGDIYFDRESGSGCVVHRRKIWAMEQELSGKLVINGREISFDSGKGYLEERKGDAAKPSTVFWTQCNWFGERTFRIVCGGRGRRCFAWIDQDGYHIRLAGWKGAKVEYMCQSGFRISQGRYVLEGWRGEEKPVESLEQTVRYRLSHGSDILFDEISQRGAYVYEGSCIKP